MNSSASFYIPRMSLRQTEDMVKAEFANKGIHVYSVDFTPVHKEQHGFKEIYDSQFMSAFVYIIVPYCYNKTYDEIITSFVTKTLFKFQVSASEYWILLKNNYPIPRSKMNVHQITENARYLELKIEEQQVQLETQQKLLEAQNRLLTAHQEKIEELEYRTRRL